MERDLQTQHGDDIKENGSDVIQQIGAAHNVIDRIKIQIAVRGIADNVSDQIGPFAQCRDGHAQIHSHDIEARFAIVHSFTTTRVHIEEELEGEKEPKEAAEQSEEADEDDRVEGLRGRRSHVRENLVDKCIGQMNACLLCVLSKPPPCFCLCCSMKVDCCI